MSWLSVCQRLMRGGVVNKHGTMCIEHVSLPVLSATLRYV